MTKLLGYTGAVNVQVKTEANGEVSRVEPTIALALLFSDDGPWVAQVCIHMHQGGYATGGVRWLRRVIVL